jgi:hypothetical protein
LARAEIVEDVLFGKASIDTDVKVVEMTARLVEALDRRTTAAAVDTGLFLFLKVPDGDGKYQMMARRLTVSDRAALNEDPTLVQRPTEILELLKARRIEPERLGEIRNAAIAQKPSKKRHGRRGHTH